jgi:putative ABC transport system permease protein
MTKRISVGDLLALGVVGIRARVARSALTALGITVGIAALVSVMGVSASSRADLMRTLDELGTNYLRVTPGQGVFGDQSTLPDDARAMLARLDGVEAAAGLGAVDGTVRRTDYIDESRTSGISIRAADPALLDTLNGSMASGVFINDATTAVPAVVLGATAAQRLGITAANVESGTQIWLADQWFTVIGIMTPLQLAADLDATALVGPAIAASHLGFDGAPTTVYVRADADRVDEVRTMLPAMANVEDPNEVEVSRPSDALEAKAAAGTAFTALLIGLGAVALLVGGIGIANVMIIAVLERRSEIGLRRAVGATRGNIAVQFLVEAVLQAGAGGVMGTLAGSALTAIYAGNRGWQVAIPTEALVGGVLAAVIIGAVAGLYPATRAARLAPADALRPA